MEHFLGSSVGKGGKVVKQIENLRIGFENTISTITHCKWMKHCMDIITMFMDRIFCMELLLWMKLTLQKIDHE